LYRQLVITVAALAAIYSAWRVFPVLDGKEQYDFRTYYWAATALEKGLDPYEVQSLREVSGRPIFLTYIYPPYTLGLFRPLARLGYSRAYGLFFGLKLVALGFLILIWARVVPTGKAGLWAVAVTALLGYKGAALRDLVAGNLSIFEQVLIWGGICLLLRGRALEGGIALFLSGTVKLVPLALGPLVFVIGRRRRDFFLWLGLTAAAGLLVLGSYFSRPGAWRSFYSSMTEVSFFETGDLNPSSLAFLKDVSGRLGAGATFPVVTYACWSALVLAAWFWAFRKTFASADRLPIVYLTVLAYVLVSPKMKDYSLLIAALPTLHALCAVLPGRRRLFGCALLWIPLFPYQGVLLVAGTFFLLLRWVQLHRGDPGAKLALSLDPLEFLKDCRIVPRCARDL